MKVGLDETGQLQIPVMKVGQELFLGAGFVFDTPNGHFFEYTLGDIDQGYYEVYRVHLGRDVARQFSHLLVLDQGIVFCKTLGVTPTVWHKKAKGTVAQRVECIMDVAAVFGWEAIDEDPMGMTEEEIRSRWNYKRAPGPVTTGGDVVATVRELLVALLHENPLAHWDLFNRDFPLIPTEPSQDHTHVWWGKHGSEVLGVLVTEIRKNAPPEMVFEERGGRWGFWYT